MRRLTPRNARRKIAWASAFAIAHAVANAGCAVAPEEETSSSSAEASALAEAENDFAELLPLLSRHVAERASTAAKPASLQPLGGGGGNAETLCGALGTAAGARRELPNFYVFVGAAAGAAAGLGVTEGAETVWDLTHQQQAVFAGREQSVGTSAGVTAGVYAGVGILDVGRAKANGDDLDVHDVIDGWSGEYFGASVGINVPFKLAWASAGCVADKTTYFFACSLSAGLGLTAALLPLDGEIMKGKFIPHKAWTRALSERAPPHVIPMPIGEFEEQKYPYVQYRPTSIPGVDSSRHAHALRAVSMLRSMPVSLAVVATPLALAIAVDADSRRARGVSPSQACLR